MVGKTGEDLIVSVRRVPGGGGEHELHKYSIKLDVTDAVEVGIQWE